MVTGPAKEGTLGFATYLLVAAAMAMTFLLGGLLVGSDPVQERISFPSLGEAVDDGTAFTMAVVAFFVTLPLLVAGVAALFGRRAGMTGDRLRGAAALNALVGIPISFIVFALGLVIVSALVGEDGQRSALSAVMDLIVEGLLFMLVALGPLVAFAALVTQVTEQLFDRRHGHGHVHHEPHAHPHGGSHHVAEEHHDHGDAAHDHVHQMHINCPRCGTEFIAEGERPLRIACPHCGKTGTIQ